MNVLNTGQKIWATQELQHESDLPGQDRLACIKLGHDGPAASFQLKPLSLEIVLQQ